MKKTSPYLCMLLFVMLSIDSYSQKKVIPPGLEYLYQYDYHHCIDKFEREHIPLDGNMVQYIPIRKDELYGFAEKATGKTIIAPKYKEVFAVYPEGAIVKYGRGYGVIDYHGKFIIEPVFQNLFKEGNGFQGLLCGIVDTTYPERYQGSIGNYFFDISGKFLFTFKCHEQEDFVLNDTIAWYRFGPTYSVYNRQGKILKEFPFDKDNRFCGIFNNTLVFEARGNESTYTGYDIKGEQLFSVIAGYNEKMVFKLNDTMFGAFSDDGLFFVNDKGEPYPFGIYNGYSGFGFENLLPFLFGEQHIVVRNDETKRFGLLSKKGKLLLPARYHYLGSSRNGEIAYLDSVKNAIGFIDTLGNTTVPPVIVYSNTDRLDAGDEPLQFSDGLCMVYTGWKQTVTNNDDMDKTLGYIDHQGKVVISLPDSVILAGPFSDGLAPVITKGGDLGFINKKGELAIPYKYEAALVGSYPFPQLVLPKFIGGYAYIKSFKGYIDTKGKEYFSGKRMMDYYNFSH